MPVGASAPIARVLVNSPLPQLDRLFDYGIPESLAGQVVPGIRVKIPLRSVGRTAEGYVVEVVRAGGYDGVLSDIESVVSPVRVLAPEVWALARKASERAAGSANDIIRLAVPTRQVRIEKVYLASEGNEPFPVIATTPIAHYGPRVLETAIELGERLAVDALPLVSELTVEGRQTWVNGWAVTMAAAGARAVAGGRTAILCVPDYRDQEQLEAALAAILPPEAVVRLDAKQSNPDRYRSFLKCLEGTPMVIVGNRSVVYAPAKNLGLIAIWDDGDPLHAEPLSPYVNSRDAALLRQELQECALMFFAHTRSTEVERLVELRWLRSVSPVPAILPIVIPTAQQVGGDRLAVQARIPSSAWQTARKALEKGPVLVQVARPGYAPRLSCAECHQTARCQRCEGPLVQKSQRSVPACMWCGALAVSWRCSHCEGDKLRLVGSGAARTAEDLGRAFPGVRIIVADGERPVLAIGAEPALIIATRGAEPVAAAGFRAVLLLDGEQMVARESLRVGEDCLRWWSNAVALAAPGAPTVLVGVGGALASALVTWNQASYARAELVDRRRLRFPPAVRVATVTGGVDEVSRVVAGLSQEEVVGPQDVLGPVDVATGVERTIIRFDYARGAAIAAALRSQLIRAATSRRKIPRTDRGRTVPNLKIRLDDVEPFLEG
jgi:primosomal protein N' (replication factor Y)